MKATRLKLDYSNGTFRIWGCEMCGSQILYQEYWYKLDPRMSRRDALILSLIEKYDFSMEEMPYPVYLAVRRRAGKYVGDYIARYSWELPGERPPAFWRVVSQKRIIDLLMVNDITPAKLRSWHRSGWNRFKRNAILLNGFGPKRIKSLWDDLERYRFQGPLGHVNPDPEEARLFRQAIGRFWSSSRRAIAEFRADLGQTARNK